MDEVEVGAAFEESGSTADNSTAEGVVLVGNAVAAGLGVREVLVGALKRFSSDDRCASSTGGSVRDVPGFKMGEDSGCCTLNIERRSTGGPFDTSAGSS
jgi:hypothetical protein